MLGKFFDKILHEDEASLNESLRGKIPSQEKFKHPWVWAVIFFAAAFIFRIGILFFMTIPENVGPGWYGDVYHHWQIAYLSKTVGFKEGFLRLWDFKGLEYYWGLLHPLTLIVAFTLSGSTSVVIARMVSVIFGSGVVALIFLILARYFDKKIAILGSLFASFIPVSAFSDTLGMQEPLGLFFILLGIFLWIENPFFSGFALMLAGMVRSEYWIFSVLIILAFVFVSKTDSHHKVMICISYLVLALIYMKYLLDYTGNPIYPVWTAYLATYKGDWFLDVALTPLQSSIKLFSQLVFVASLSGVLLTVWKRPKATALFLLGFLNIALISAMHGFGAYIRGFELKVLVDRLLAFPYTFLGILASIIFVYYLPKIFPKKIHTTGIILGLVVCASILLVAQFAWIPILKYYRQAIGNFQAEVDIAKVVSRNYKREGKIFLPSDRAVLTYALVTYEKIPGDKLISQLYDPFYYYKGDNPFANWEEFRKEVIKWLVKNDAELYVTAVKALANEDRSFQERMLGLEKGKLFRLLEEKQGFSIYGVILNAEE